MTNNGQLSPKENPASSRLAKDSKTDSKTKSRDVLKEIIHKAVTFTPASLDRDTIELNNAITRGYEINDYVRTETGIVYILTKWSNHDISKNQDDKQNSSCGDLP